MARKSRQAIHQGKTPASVKAKEPQKPKFLKTGIYGRLSVRDLGIEDGDTMENQIAFLRDYVVQHPDLELTDVYVDNGWTGTNFHRPEFNRLIEDIKNGKINCIVVKDLSRFGRNYLETGYYLQKVFPSYQLRFIAVYDDYDSLTSDPDSMVISMKNIVNDYYSKDISRKISATIDLKREQGIYNWGLVPYGYIRDKENPTHLLIDKDAAPIVRLIFCWAMEGLTCHQIALNLTDMRVPTPQRMKYIQSKGKNRNSGSDTWNQTTIQQLLRNQMYAGDFVCNKSYFRKYDPMNSRFIPEEEWIILLDNHIPYISREDLQTIRSRLDEKAEERSKILFQNRAQRDQTTSLFAGMVYCSECQRKMTLRKDLQNKHLSSFVCNGKSTRTHLGHPGFSINVGKLESIVLYQLQLQLKMAIDADSFLKQLSMIEAQKKLKAKRQASLQMLVSKTAALSQKKKQAFEDLANGILDADTYRLQLQKLNQNIELLEHDIQMAKQRIDEIAQYFNPDNEWLKSFLNAKISPELNLEAVHLLISRIDVWANNHIQITFNYSDWMERLLGCISELNELEKEDKSNAK